jgi:hypothetical protein
MATARKRLVDPKVTRWYHCISRCVRKARLLGEDGLSNRKAWLEKRMEFLCRFFAISVLGYSVLDNHLHIVLRLDPDVARDWSDEEVARRWGALFPPRNRRREVLPVTQEWIDRQVAKPEWIAKKREHLASLSWFMKLLKEPLARMANAEDDCDGAFFSPRFKSIAILDLVALLAVCAYIDLNPLAAGIALLPEISPYTSITRRVEHCCPELTREDFEAGMRGVVAENLPSGEIEQSHWLCPLEDRRRQGAPREGVSAGFSLPKYLLLLDETSRLFREGKARVDAGVAPILERLGTTVGTWQRCMQQLQLKLSCRRLTGRVLATSAEALAQAAKCFGLQRLVNLVGRSVLALPAAPGG